MSSGSGMEMTSEMPMATPTAAVNEIARFEEVEKEVAAALILVICVVGLVANCFAIFVILVLQEYKKAVTHWYVFQLAIADTLFLLTLPFKASQKLNNRWIYSVTLCKAEESFLYINYYASIMFLTVMSIDRYVAVCHTLSTNLQNLRKTSVSYIVTIAVWVIAILLAVPIMLYSEVSGTSPECFCRGEFPRDVLAECFNQSGEGALGRFFCNRQFGDPDRDRCSGPLDYATILAEFLNSTEGGMLNITQSGSGTGSGSGMMVDESNVTDISNNTSTGSPSSGGGGQRSSLSPECNYFNYPEGWYLFLYLVFGVMFLLPLVIMTVCYGLIVHRILASAMASSSRVDRDRRRITYMCITLVSVFILNWAWFHIVHLAKINGIDQSHKTCSVLTEIGTLLAFANSAVNPMLYIFLGTGFFRKWQSVREAPSMRYVMNMKTRTTEFFSSNTRARTKTVDKSTSNGLSSQDSGVRKDSSHFNSISGSTKPTNGASVTNDIPTKE